MHVEGRLEVIAAHVACIALVSVSSYLVFASKHSNINSTSTDYNLTLL